MKDDLQNKLVGILASIQSTAAKAGDFAMAQLPDIAQSYVTYGRAQTALCMGLGLLLCMACALLYRHASTIQDEKESHGCSFAGSLAGAFGVLFLVMNASEALLVWFAPKVWLLKEIALLTK